MSFILKKIGCPSLTFVNRFFVFYFHLTLSGEKNVTGIQPNESSYSLVGISDAIKGARIECNDDASDNSQLCQIYLRVDNSASQLIKSPMLPKGGCASNIDFPTF